MVILTQGTSYNRHFKMISNADHLSSGTRSSPVIRIAKSGTGFTNPGNAAVELGSGWYRVLLNGTDTNTIGDLSYNITGTLCDDTDFVDQIVVFVLNDSVRAGLTALPNSSPSITGGLPTLPLFMVGGTVGSVTGTVGSVTGAVGSVTGAVGSVTTPVFVQGGTVGSVVQPMMVSGGTVGSVTGSVGSVTTPAFVQGGTLGSISGPIFLSGGTIGKVTGTVASLTANADKTGYFVAGGTVGTNFAGPVVVSGGTIGSLTGSIASVTTVTGNVNGSVNSVVTPVFVQGGTLGSISSPIFVSGGTVGSVTGSVSSVTSGVTVTTNNDKTGYIVAGGTIGNISGPIFISGGTVGNSASGPFFVAGGTIGKVTGTVASLTANADKTGYALSSSQTFDVTGNITGNLSGSVGSVTGAVDSVTGAVGSVTTPVFMQGGTVGKVTGTVASLTANADKTGYSLSSSQTFDVTGNITGNLSGSVGSVTGAVGSVTGAVGSVTTPVFVQGGTVGKVTGTVASLTSNADKTGYSLSSSQTFDVTGNITGNLSGSVGSVTGAVGSVTGAVGSVTTPVFVQGGTVGKVTNFTQNLISYVTVGTNNDKTGYSLASGQLFVKKNTALSGFMFPMVDSADHVTLKTGLTVSGEVAIDGGAFGALTNAVSELGSGVYTVNLAAADVNGSNIMLKFTAVGGDTRLIELITQT